MKNSKKGFTLVELLVVIAILAILATVAVVGYTSFTRKADISNDTVIAGELNTLLAATDVTDPIESFEDVKAALYANGFYLANLNTKTDGCYFVWDAKNNQIILVDGNDGYKVLFSKVTPSENKADWYFAVSDLSKVAAIEADGYNVERMVTDIANLAGALAAGGEFHIDKSLVLTKDNYIMLENGANVVINMGDSQLASNGILEDQIPFVINDATLVLNGGVIGAAGTGIDIDGNEYSIPLKAEAGSDVTINGTKFNTNGHEIQFAGKAVLNNVEIDGYIYSYANGSVELNDCVVDTQESFGLWVTNTIKVDGNWEYTGTSTLTINSGKYTAHGTHDTYKLVSMLAGTINIKGGEFVSPDTELFEIGHANGKLVISGGTFNGVAFEELDTVEEWKALCNGDYNVVIADGVVTITK